MSIAETPTRVSTEAPTVDEIATLARQLRGQVILPEDSDFRAARRLHGLSTALPAVIVRPVSAADVAAVVTFAREHQLELAVHSGGHSLAHYSVVEGGVVLDLSLMNAIEIDTERRTARLEAGLTWGEVAAALHPHGLGLTAGDTASVGVGGLTLGGGIGWFARKYGLTIDHVRSIEVVTADGQMVTASATEHPDLFWAMRGGGGNFGVATSFEVELHPAGMVYGGAIFYDARDAASVLPAYARYAAAAPDELTTMALVMAAPPAPFIPPAMRGKSILALTMVYSGDFEEGNHVVDPLRRLATPVADVVGPMPYPAMFEFTKEATQFDQRQYARSVMVDRVDDALISALLARGLDLPSHGALLELRILGGAMRRGQGDGGAFAQRDKGGLVMAVAYGYDEADTARHRAWVDRYYEAMRPFGTGAYVGFMMRDDEARAGEVYPPATMERLRQVKRRYDPTNVFHHNLNIEPAAE
ncbi:MAG TPA: FAD-binding oxidoreductase [Ktedonobacterales bacterium]|nr:FAD-binding oxidoreductase [Ktedonobacterales bacterium]